MAGKGSKKQITLIQALAAFLGKVLLPDLKACAAGEAVDGALKRQWEAEKAAKRTADGYPAWRDRTLEQIGAAWVLSCVFVRTLEDRDLLARRRLAGAGALDSEQLFFELAPSLTARDYLLTVFREVSSLPGAEELLGAQHNPLWRLGPSAEVARALLGFFRQEDEKGGLVWRFDGGDTRFLGDLYQDLSEDVRKRYALLQTPDFVERFILGETLDPAIAEFGLEAVRVIDPTCGSGHFLLGAFDRLLNLRLQSAPGVDVRDHAVAALSQVYGVDVNPYAVAIARFRLTLSYLQRTGIAKLAQAPRLPLNLVVADSLLHGAKKANLLFAEHESAEGNYEAWGAEMFALDDPQAARRIFGQTYHAVVGNPPYISPSDSATKQLYRERFPRSACGDFQLVSPFIERFIQLASNGAFIGTIVGNGFTKRDFGKAVIEGVLSVVEVNNVVDTSVAYIPGHGTPTLILFLRNRIPIGTHVVMSLGKRGERKEPSSPSSAPVWAAIEHHFDDVGFENEYISVEAVPRAVLRRHPWITRGGGVRQLKERIEGALTTSTLTDLVDAIGRSTHTGEDSAFFVPPSAPSRLGIPLLGSVPLVKGEQVRDWMIVEDEECLFPYFNDGTPRTIESGSRELAFYWRFKTTLRNRQDYGEKIEKRKAGGRFLRWVDHSMFFPERFRIPLSITFAFVATHNHFVLDRGGKVFKQSAPIIKLPESATEDDHLALLAYLNSSTACFWMKQIFYPKGGDQMGDGGRLSATEWEDRFEFAGTGLQSLPLPKLDATFVDFGRRIDALATQRANLSPTAVIACTADGDIKTALVQAEALDARLFQEMVALQEQLDWYTYKVFGLIEKLPTLDSAVEPGHRPFECLAFASFGEDDPDKDWFRRSRFSEPTAQAQEKSQEAITAIQASRELSLIETFNYKRRWNKPQFSDNLNEAARAAFLDAAELGFRGITVPVSARRIADSACEPPLASIVALIPNAQDAATLQKLLLSESVPFRAAEIFKEASLEKHAAWRHTWDLQRREDLGEAVGEIPVPPKYDSKDYRDADYWRLRGKLDVPKERFISYPGCQKDGDPSPLIGWAGWTHLQRAQALVALYQERKTEDAWPKERLMPMLVGLHELMFWLDLWHSKPEAGSQNPAREFKQFLDAELHAHALTSDDLEAWRPTLGARAARTSAASRRAAPEGRKQESKKDRAGSLAINDGQRRVGK